MDLHKIIHQTLNELIQSCNPKADLSSLDDVLLSYITGVLENLGSQDSMEENFDVEVFIEMLEAYIPGFAEIDSVKVCEMMFNLASKLATARGAEHFEPKTALKVPLLIESSASGTSMQNTQDLSTQAEGGTAKAIQESTLSTEAKGNKTAVPRLMQKNISGNDSQVQHLLEMFPKCSVTEATSALSIAKGDMEEAVRLIIEGDVQLSHNPPLNANSWKAISLKADEKLKAAILEKYMLVDNEEDKKIHRPVTPKDAPKKLVRYHGNQVVSTKGERYHQVKNEETEEVKKTYINLKPARKYRFH
ncbi:CUE domain-containing protein 2 isoform X2 [Scleropages formosus]|uniref:CUE domain containing 2 n=1 Tax=Scleropages formosus TaxID=113540 RepID=A0A8C9RC06_SCLFO|nr:CUE domain-containing protein 2 isoform X2 [Scleropages formosus]